MPRDNEGEQSDCSQHGQDNKRLLPDEHSAALPGKIQVLRTIFLGSLGQRIATDWTWVLTPRAEGDAPPSEQDGKGGELQGCCTVCFERSRQIVGRCGQRRPV